MDLLTILRSKIDVLEEGDYIPGLRAVLLHIETASRHLLRGQEQGDEAAFTDAIYRTNQAFEGSLKEAYRVLAQQNPERERPFDIENFFERESVFRQRVLAQFTNYRTEWRNPSTHDYKLDFDESEAFLAIVSVAAFACLVLDQITEKLSYLKAKAAADAKQIEIQEHLAKTEESDLLSRIVGILREFSRQPWSFNTEGSKRDGTQVRGQLEGFFASAAPDLELSSDYVLSSGKLSSGKNIAMSVDFVISDGSSRVLVELKKSKGSAYVGVPQLAYYMLSSNIKFGILYLFADTEGELEIEEHIIPSIDGKLLILKPEEKRPSVSN